MGNFGVTELVMILLLILIFSGAGSPGGALRDDDRP
jgi:hypothetical protein